MFFSHLTPPNHNFFPTSYPKTENESGHTDARVLHRPSALSLASKRARCLYETTQCLSEVPFNRLIRHSFVWEGDFSNQSLISLARMQTKISED